jgi:hypothetical protein
VRRFQDSCLRCRPGFCFCTMSFSTAKVSTRPQNAQQGRNEAASWQEYPLTVAALRSDISFSGPGG